MHHKKKIENLYYYLKNYYVDKIDLDSLSNEIIKDGWLYTGDEGSIDNEGFLKITGRVKDIFKTTKGKYVAPTPIEMKLSENNYIEQVCVVGSGIPQPIALAVLSEVGKESPHVTESVQKTLNNVNENLEKHEVLKNIVLVKENWTVENNFLTHSMKIKRNTIDKKYQENYSKWHDQDKIVVL